MKKGEPIMQAMKSALAQTGSRIEGVYSGCSSNLTRMSTAERKSMAVPPRRKVMKEKGPNTPAFQTTFVPLAYPFQA